jgi:hypothetical protein
MSAPDAALAQSAASMLASIEVEESRLEVTQVVNDHDDDHIYEKGVTYVQHRRYLEASKARLLDRYGHLIDGLREDKAQAQPMRMT